ncbi:Type I transmembrane sorting receptor [Tulasnella sp. 408]|nr:Type I transmembrane sorting receptor [Tulasnella sp. 408]
MSARQTRTYDSVHDVKREVQRLRKRAQRFHDKMERSGVGIDGPMLKRSLNPVAPQPYDIGQSRRLAKTKRQGSATDPLTNYMDKSKQNFFPCIVILVLSIFTNGTEVYGDLSVGTPSQTITVEFDTGSADLVIPVSDCKACVSPFFDTHKSSTFSDLNQPFNTSFGSGAEAFGYLASDTVSLGDLSVENQIFAIINNATDNFDKPNSGLIGFGFQKDAASHATSWFFNLAKEGKLASNVASFYISRQEASGSEACIGCIDSSKFTGDPEYFPLSPGNSSQALWTVVTQGITYDNKPVLDEPLLSAFDTGGSYVVVPSKVAKALHSHIPGSQYNAEIQVYTFPCDKASSIAPIGLMFGTSSTVFNIHPSQLNLGEVEKSNKCISAIVPSEVWSIELIGDAFLSSWYSIFDYGNMRMGFAAAV